MTLLEATCISSERRGGSKSACGFKKAFSYFVVSALNVCPMVVNYGMFRVVSGGAPWEGKWEVWWMAHSRPCGVCPCPGTPPPPPLKSFPLLMSQDVPWCLLGRCDFSPAWWEFHSLAGLSLVSQHGLRAQRLRDGGSQWGVSMTLGLPQSFLGHGDPCWRGRRGSSVDKRASLRAPRDFPSQTRVLASLL